MSAEPVLGTATSPDGGVRVHATSAGLPTHVQIAPEALRGGEKAVARSVLAATRLAAVRAGVHERAVLVRRGVSPATLDSLGLPRPQDLPDDDHADTGTWMRRS